MEHQDSGRVDLEHQDPSERTWNTRILGRVDLEHQDPSE